MFRRSPLVPYVQAFQKKFQEKVCMYIQVCIVQICTHTYTYTHIHSCHFAFVPEGVL